MISLTGNNSLEIAVMGLTIPSGGGFFTLAAEIECDDLTDGSLQLFLGSNGADQRPFNVALYPGQTKTAGSIDYLWLEPGADGLYGINASTEARGVVWRAKFFAYPAPADVLVAP